MGCVQSDTMTESYAPKSPGEVKMLLTGSGNSGKSTICKQMTIIYGQGYSEEHRRQFVRTVHCNALHSMVALVEAMDELEIEYGDPAREQDGQEICLLGKSTDACFTMETATTVKTLWNDTGIQTCFRRSSEFHLYDSAEYYFDSLDRICQPDYTPTEQDILRSRCPTTGILETEFNYKGKLFRMFDMGGQRLERTKWINCCERATAIIYVAALSDYDLTLEESPGVNRLKESLTLFEIVCNAKWYATAPIILFLNKTDIFKKKITTSSLDVCFPNYKGDSYEDAADYIRTRFEKTNKMQETKTIYSHFTCATDTENVKFVFDAVTNIIIRQNLEDVGFM